MPHSLRIITTNSYVHIVFKSRLLDVQFKIRFLQIENPFLTGYVSSMVVACKLVKIDFRKKNHILDFKFQNRRKKWKKYKQKKGSKKINFVARYIYIYMCFRG